MTTEQVNNVNVTRIAGYLVVEHNPQSDAGTNTNNSDKALNSH